MYYLNTPVEMNTEFLSSFIDVEGEITAKTIQASGDLIHIKNSRNVRIITYDAEQISTLNTSIQAVITLFLQTILLDSETAELITQEMKNKFSIKQANKKEIFIENSAEVVIDLRNHEVAYSLQFFMQVLIALISEFIT
ncbi:hypothetical protein WQ54_03395 [Bacillus sp. SA1-12]|uniref:spore coat protein n=1 Tax=Bacillus sp. SA1-12 TaxID=1455638 RepID=UPI0006252C25|nr:spore coat protein [Bacillus sp. SA1-12]KKI93664.1 hypothetical protein WQ54_03395 [Bacillus sp. SA1-12]